MVTYLSRCCMGLSLLLAVVGSQLGCEAWGESAPAADKLIGEFAPPLPTSPDLPWINSQPLSWGALSGRIVLVEFWSIGSWPSLHSVPTLRDLYSKLQTEGVQFVTFHSPQFPDERDRIALEKKIKEFSISFPVVVDDSSSYAAALEIQTRPAFLVVDRRGKIRARFDGEIRPGDAASESLEKAIRTLLKEVH